MSDLNLYLDTRNSRLVISSVDTEGFTLPKFYQNDQRTVSIYPMTPHLPLSTSTPFDLLDWSARTLRVGLQGGTGSPLGSGDTVAINADYAWVWSTDHFEGVIDLDTEDCATFLATSPKTSTLEFEFTDGSGRETTYQFVVSVVADVLKDATPGEPGAASGTYQHYNSTLLRWEFYVEGNLVGTIP